MGEKELKQQTPKSLKHFCGQNSKGKSNMQWTEEAMNTQHLKCYRRPTAISWKFIWGVLIRISNMEFIVTYTRIFK